MNPAQRQTAEGILFIFRDDDIVSPQRLENPDHLQSAVKHLIHPHFHHVSLTERLRQLKQSLVTSVRRAFS